MVQIAGVLSKFAIPFMIAGIISFGIKRNVKVYDSFIEGAKSGFETFVRIIPSFVAMRVAIGVFRESGAMDIFTNIFTPVLKSFSIPKEVVPMIFMRPLSGGGAQGIISDLAKTYGPESLATKTAAVMSGSTETTFYVLAVYLGSIYIKKQRHTLISCLTADIVGLLSAIYISRIFFR